MIELYSIVWIYQILFIHPLVGVHFGCFFFFAIINKAVINICI